MWRLWLSRRPDGKYLLSKLPVIRRRVRGTRRDDLYLTPGEPVGVQNLCADGVAAALGRELEPFESRRVRLHLELESP